MRPRSLVRSRLAAAAVALVALGGVAGCANANPSVAAYVDGTPITSKQLDAAVAGVGETIEEGQQVSPQAVLDALVQGAIAEKLAAQNDIVITDAQRDTALKGSNLEPLLPIPAAKAVAYDVVDQQLVAAKLGGQAYLAAVAKQRVTVNPRYGVLDPSQQLIVDGKSGSLAKPASPSASPTP